jgi:GTPase SAR1 family protein
VFVSRPDSGEPYAGHPRAAEYAKGLEQLADDPNRQYHFLMTLLMMGDGGVGKSSYLLRLTDDRFTHEYTPTMDVDFKIVHRGFCDPVLPLSMERSPVGVKLQIWGTAGRTIPVSSLRGASGYFMLFDVSDRESFESIPRWVSEMQRYGREDAPAVLIGMKQDIAWPDEAASSGLPSGGKDAATAATAGDVNGRCSHREQCRQVSYDEGLAMAQQFDMPYVECSAKDNVHIEDALATLVYHIMRSRADLERRTQDHIFGRYSPRPSGDGWASKGVVKVGCVVS